MYNVNTARVSHYFCFWFGLLCFFVWRLLYLFLLLSKEQNEVIHRTECRKKNKKKRNIESYFIQDFPFIFDFSFLVSFLLSSSSNEWKSNVCNCTEIRSRKRKLSLRVVYVDEMLFYYYIGIVLYFCFLFPIYAYICKKEGKNRNSFLTHSRKCTQNSSYITYKISFKTNLYNNKHFSVLPCLYIPQRIKKTIQSIF